MIQASTLVSLRRWISSRQVMPPEAMMGICTAAVISARDSKLGPDNIPSREISVKIIPAAPNCSISLARSIARRLVSFSQPWTATIPSRASIPITTCLPKVLIVSSAKAASPAMREPMITLVAPAARAASMFSADLIPPPICTGSPTFAIRRKCPRAWGRPVRAPSRSTTWRNCAPCRAHCLATAAGSS